LYTLWWSCQEVLAFGKRKFCENIFLRMVWANSEKEV
jgi:hypothetical protein